MVQFAGIRSRSLVYRDDAFGYRWTVSQSTVRSDSVVVAPPFLDQDLGLADMIYMKRFSPREPIIHSCPGLCLSMVPHSTQEGGPAPSVGSGSELTRLNAEEIARIQVQHMVEQLRKNRAGYLRQCRAL